MFGTDSTNVVLQQEYNGLQWIRADCPLHVTRVDKLFYRGRVKDENLVMFRQPKPKEDLAGCVSADIRGKPEGKSAGRDRPFIDGEARDGPADDDATAIGQCAPMHRASAHGNQTSLKRCLRTLTSCFLTSLLCCFLASLLFCSLALLHPCFLASFAP